MEQLTKSIKKLLKSNKKATLIFIIGLIGIFMIAFGGLEQASSDETSTASRQSDEEYCKEIENKIKELVTAITGNDNCIVAVTLENTGEYIYANQNTLDTNQTEDKASDTVITKESHKSEQEYIIVKGKDGEQTALVVTEKKPGVRGVAIVASGINNMNYDLISSSVSAMLGIPGRKISIAESG